MPSWRRSQYIICFRGKKQLETWLLKIERRPDNIPVFFFPKHAARQRSVVSAWAAGENPGSEGDTLFTLPSSISVWLLRGCVGEQQPKGKCGQTGTKGHFEKGPRSKCSNCSVLLNTTLDIVCDSDFAFVVFLSLHEDLWQPGAGEGRDP